MALDRIDVGGDQASQGAGIARAGADLEDAVAAGQRRCLEHQGDDVGLRDRLAFGDGQRRVFVGLVAKVGGDEFFARQPPHRREDGGVADAARGELLADHELALRAASASFTSSRRASVVPSALLLLCACSQSSLAA